MMRAILLLSFLFCFAAQSASAIGTGEMLVGLAKLGIKPGSSKITTCTAAGSSPTTDAKDLQACIEGAGDNAVIRFVPNKTYILDRPLFPQDGQTWIGYGVVLKRCNAISTTVSTTITSGSSNSFTVASATGFDVGQAIAVYQTGTPYGDSANHSIDAYQRITDITSNVITVAGAITLEDAGSLTAGTASVEVAGQLINLHHARTGGAPTDVTNFTLLGFEIDGNRSAGGAFSSWQTHVDIYGNDSGTNDPPVQNTFDSNWIHDSLSEGLSVSGKSTVRNNRFENAGGNFIHFYHAPQTTVTDNWFQGGNLTGNKTTGTGHEDGCIASSSYNGTIRIINNYLAECIAPVGGIEDENSDHFQITGNMIKDMRVQSLIVERGGSNQMEANVASDNQVVNTGGRLDYTSETANFTVGDTLTGGTSGATGTIYFLVDNGTTGELYLKDVTGTFQSSTGETITDEHSGSATSSPETTLHALVYPVVTVTANATAFSLTDGPKRTKLQNNYFENVLGYLYRVEGVELTGNTWYVTDGTGDNDRDLLQVNDVKDVRISDRFIGGENGLYISFPQGGPHGGPTAGYERTGNVWVVGSEFINNYRYGILTSTSMFGRRSGVMNSRFIGEAGIVRSNWAGTCARPGFDVIGNTIEFGTSSQGAIIAFGGGSWASGDDGPIIQGNVVRGTGAAAIRLNNTAYSCLVTGNITNEDESVFQTSGGSPTNNLVQGNIKYNATAHVEAPFITFTDQDATPDVQSGSKFKTANTGATTITDFDGGFVGQTIIVVIGDANTDIDFTASGLKGNGGADWTTAAADDSLECTYDGTDWFCEVHDN